MDKRVIFAVAGSGKTTQIVNQLSLDKRSLVITYTNNNIKNLRDGILEKFEYFPDNITLLPYFTFLYSFCYRPFLSYKTKAKGIYWKNPPSWTYKLRRSNFSFYATKDRMLYHNRIAKFLETQDVLNDINSRLLKYFDNLFIDEIQDFAGHDFNFLKSISKADIEMIFVGDFYQHTFDTSRDGNVNSSLHKDYKKYKATFEKMGITVDVESLEKSYRCSPVICNFITKMLDIEIYSHRNDKTNIHFVETSEQANEIFQNKGIVKLFYGEHYKYDCYSRNWGGSKGENRYDDVCVVLNQTTLKKFEKMKLNELNPQTKNKLYVACSRTKNDLHFVSDHFYAKYKQRKMQANPA